jgi:hypothetical protein
MAKRPTSTSDDVPLQRLSSNTRDDDTSKPASTPGRESRAGPSRPPQPLPSSPQSPLTHLKARLSLFKPRHNDHDHDHHHHDSDEEENSENELLLDPNLPADHAQRHHPIPLHTLPALPTTKPSLDLASDSDSDRAPLVPPGEDDEDGKEEEEEEEIEDSPYPEVRAAVHPYDDHTLPCNTLRAWAIGLSLIFLGASMNTLFSLRSPNISLGPLIAQVIAWYVSFFPLLRGGWRGSMSKELGWDGLVY